MAKKILPPKKKKSSPVEPTLKLSDSKIRTSINFDEREFASIRTMKVGEKYTLELEVEMTSLGKDEWDSGKLRAEFRINEVELCDEEDEKE